MGACEVDTLCDDVAFGHCVLHREAKIRKTRDESGKEPRPGLGVERVGLQTRRRMRNVIRPKEVSLRNVVALIKGVDPPARNGLVVFYRIPPTRIGWVAASWIRRRFVGHAISSWRRDVYGQLLPSHSPSPGPRAVRAVIRSTLRAALEWRNQARSSLTSLSRYGSSATTSRPRWGRDPLVASLGCPPPTRTTRCRG